MYISIHICDYHAVETVYLVYFMKSLYNKLMPVVQISLSETDKQSITDHVNKYRALHASPPLIWDDSIATFADSWSAYLLKNNSFYHSNNASYGENLAYFQGYTATPIELIKKSIDLWYDEIRMYDFNASQYTSGTGHFTCLVWKASRLHGFGYAYNTNTKEVIISMNTSPPGNIIGQFKENVLPLVDNSVPAPLPMPSPAPLPAPEPVPLPMPSPAPLPAPEPVTDDRYKLLKQSIIADLSDIINKIQTRYPRYIISNSIMSVYNKISRLPATELYNKYNIMNALTNSINAIKYRYATYIVIRVLNNVIIEVQRSLSL